MTQHKDRKSEAQKGFEQAASTGRFAINNADIKTSWNQSIENVNDDTGRPLNENEISHARNNSNEGERQGRSRGGRGRREKIY